MMHANDQIEQEVMSLFENGSLHVNDMRRFFKESVCDYLDSDPEHQEHEAAAYRIFDRWYRNLRKTIWTNAAKYALTKNGWPQKEATTEANTMYQNAYHHIDRKRRNEAHNED